MLQQCLWVEVNLTFQDWIQLKIRIRLVSERPLSPFPVTVISKKVKHMSLLLKLHIHLHITIILKVRNQIKLCIKNIFITQFYLSYPPSYFRRNTFLPVVIENKNRQRTQLLKPRKGSLATIWRIKSSFSTSDTTTQPLEKEVRPLSGESIAHSLAQTQLLNPQKRKSGHYLENQTFTLQLEYNYSTLREGSMTIF